MVTAALREGSEKVELGFRDKVKNAYMRFCGSQRWIEKKGRASDGSHFKERRMCED
jgi:hypothetical protein